MTAIRASACGALSSDADKAARQLYLCHREALHSYIARFCPDWASAEDIVQETFIRAWRHLPQLSADDRPVRPWLFRVARNLLIDANRAAQARPMSASEQSAEIGTDSGLDEVLDRQLLSAALQHLSPAHQSVLVEPSTAAEPWPRSLASSASRTVQPDRGCTTRWMRCASTSKS